MQRIKFIAQSRKLVSKAGVKKVPGTNAFIKALFLKARSGSELSNEERGKTERMRLAGKKIGEITIAINCHRNMVSNYLKHGDNYSRTKHSSHLPTNFMQTMALCQQMAANRKVIAINTLTVTAEIPKKKVPLASKQVQIECYAVVLKGKDTPNAKALRGDITTKQTVSKLRADKPEEIVAKTSENYWQTVKNCKSSKKN
uniref:Tc3 transposase DNA binding domain-containing protein n=1 Tax=Glossina pallidipes TaxID=7398 RepID=A0A1A9ZEF4_GLOPL